jgi:DMSO/TMAO reductase YedYZ molybdopterin-dependent catalytic subunit
MRPLPTGEPWGDYAVSTARWTGALLHEVLEEVHPAADGVDVRFEGADHGRYHLQPILPETNKDDLTFVRALPLALAADPMAEILIAYEMNGEPLTPDHGAPFRIIVPHWYAVTSVKWLKRIDVLTEPYTGEFQTGHYIYEWPDRPHEAVSLMRVRARITDPAPGSTLSVGTHTVRGKAWSGTGPVTRVDVSFTGEGDWHPAQLEPPKGPYQWQDWSLDWEATDVGRHTLRARATDAAGNVQPEVPPWNRLGYGNNAIEVWYVDVL